MAQAKIEQAAAPAFSKYQIWYRNNREKVAAQRREKYQSDPKYRKKNQKACKAWRQKNKPWLKRERVERSYVLIGEFSKMVGCSPETLRNLEKMKLLPKATNGVARRKYNPENVILVQELVEFRKDNHYTDKGYAKKLKGIVANLKKSWRKVV